AGLPLTTEPPEVHPRLFDGRPHPEQLVGTPEVAAGRAGCLLDARTGERFRGEAEPIDPVAGHIPGALSLPLQRNLDPATGRFQPAAQLHALYAGLLDGRDPATVTHYCGSGVSACHNLLAMEHAGLHGSRLYPGSWSEWIRDPARPVATGAE
ncbi:MAG TPA: rhodanese-like domain-containing protein, partial [Gammaproteobacteria bacterium]